jgi:hypothetical protein
LDIGTVRCPFDDTEPLSGSERVRIEVGRDQAKAQGIGFGGPASVDALRLIESGVGDPPVTIAR